ncbi:MULTISPECIES: HAD-IA family hydrolase [Staphylococcus]|uniref:HAD-IA family hydrolase n=1 Tax=Staphylococcus TaxID=1279 RepID=UPI00024E4A23|nr:MULTISPECIES: HAD-IA family hydrolase [Staphylococcus]EHS03197.1 HAD hydrolase, family IA, variant 3 [Staphylococcus epidermidis VCU129]EJE06923.1 HAD hydrolase, family IA, variant 3 [Staphylococcus epidermidis NIHLM037]EJE15496.1 HAD hydrolase, family IA, variant 3 [Staphylococcus epidermidis NIHLM015]MBM0751430.1 HAD family hydrolase [Staphylococcus epidermidis]MCD8868588.1 HAD-IA family hydrolase [Staphylococcus epidermidis]
MYKAVVFDFDGTVIDTEKHLFDLINTHLKIHQEAPISLEFYKQFIGGETTGLHTYLVDAIGFKNKEKIYDQYYQTIIELPVNPTIIQLMQYLKKRHIPMAIATSSYKKNIYPIFKQLGLDTYIDVVVGRENVESVQPNPEIYLKAVQELNYNPTTCLAIEDSVNGATAAMLAGLDVVVNTNIITKDQDFSTVQYVGQDMEFEDIKNFLFKE